MYTYARIVILISITSFIQVTMTGCRETTAKVASKEEAKANSTNIEQRRADIMNNTRMPEAAKQAALQAMDRKVEHIPKNRPK